MELRAPGGSCSAAQHAEAEIARAVKQAVVIFRAMETLNVEVTGAARLYRAASVWTAGLAVFAIDTSILASRKRLVP